MFQLFIFLFLYSLSNASISWFLSMFISLGYAISFSSSTHQSSVKSFVEMSPRRRERRSLWTRIMMAFPRLLPGHQMSLSLGLMAVSSSSWFLTATSDKKKRKKDPMLTNHDFGFTARLLISCGVFSIDELIQRFNP